MTDPFEAPFAALRALVLPVDPDPAYVAALRARIERALAVPKGVRVSTTTLQQSPAATMLGGGVTPNLAVADARAALRWYADVLGARPHGEPIVMPDGRIGHAEIELVGGLLMLADEHPELGFVAPRPGAGTSVLLHAEIADVDALVQRAVAAGATLESAAPGRAVRARCRVPRPVRAPMDAHHAAHRSRPGAGGRRGLRLAVGSGRRARRRLLRRGPGLGLRAGARRTQPAGDGGHSPARHPRRAAAQHAVPVLRGRRSAGRGGTGTPGRRAPADPHQEPYGLVADCVDDQGVPFALYQRTAADERPPANGARPGDVAYLTLEVVDSARARAFYGTVLGWRFTPGRVADGWNVEDVSPMAGMHGGQERATTVPMYRVDDIDAALRRVRAAGGTATDPARMPYGITADCVDDQGTRFWLGQL